MKFDNDVLRMYRARKHMSQREVAEKCNIGLSTYFVIESAKKITQINNLIKIFEVLDLSDEEIIQIIRGK